jgi:hypothetical protein
MKSFDTELKKYADKIRLRARERRELRERVLSYMEYHPLPKQNGAALEVIESQPFFTVHFNSLYARIVGGALAVLILVVVPVAAERSVPGDVLYLVKTEINESIQSQFANSPYEKVVHETKLIERRIAEARLLASEGKLTVEVEAAIAKNVKEHADAAQIGLEELRGNNADEAAIAEIAFDSALEVQSAVLNSNTNNTSSSTRSIAEAVRTAQAEAVQKRASTTPSYGALLTRIESETLRARELFDAIYESATDEERTDIERRFSDIERKIIAARQVSEDSSEAEVSELARTLGLIHKLIVFMTDIDVRENVALETLVPIEFTIEERTEATEGVLVNTQKLYSAVEARTQLIDDESLLEKVVLGLEELENLIGTATSSLAVGEIDTAEKTVVSAFELANDLDQMTLAYVPDTEETEVPTEDATTTEALDGVVNVIEPDPQAISEPAGDGMSTTATTE